MAGAVHAGAMVGLRGIALQAGGHPALLGQALRVRQDTAGAVCPDGFGGFVRQW